MLLYKYDYIRIVPLCPIFQQDPYTMSKGSQLEGYCMDLLSELAKKLSFKYNVHLVKDGSYGRQDESGAWNGMIGEVVRKVSKDNFFID